MPDIHETMDGKRFSGDSIPACGQMKIHNLKRNSLGMQLKYKVKSNSPATVLMMLVH